VKEVVSNSNFKVKNLNNRIGQTWGKYIYMKVEVIKEKVKYIRDIKRKYIRDIGVALTL